MSERPPIRNLLNALSDRGLMDIARAIAAKHHVTVEEMLSPQKGAPYSHAKQAICHLLVAERGMSTTFVGKVLGLDHSTVYTAVKRHAARMGQSKP